jgi:hypothetical protein
MKLNPHAPLRRALPMLCAATCSTEVEPEALDHSVKASYLYNLLRFIAWPEDGTGAKGPLRLCICGGPTLDAFYALHGERAHGRAIFVRRIREVAPAWLEKCGILVLSADKPLVSVPVARGLLTVGEAEGFTARGGIINLMLMNGRVRLELNEDLAELCGFRLDPRLSKLRMPGWYPTVVR